MENEILEKSIKPDLYDPPFTNREYVYVNDKSGSNYSNDELQYDLTGLANTGNFSDFANGYLVLPVVGCVSDNLATLLDNQNDFCFGLKNGFHHLLNRISLTISNKQVIEATDFTNLPIHFKLITQMSNEAMETMGDSMGMYLDDTTGMKYISNKYAETQGFGECNNVINDVNFEASRGYSNYGMAVNKGFRRRMINTNYSLKAHNGLQKFNTEDALKLSLKNYSIQKDATERGAICYYIVATIRLGDIHDLFNKMCLVQGLSAVLKVYTNMPCSFSIEHNATPAYKQGQSLSVNLQSRASGVIPFMTPPIGGGLHLSGVEGTLTTSLALVKVIDPRQTAFNFPLHPLQSTRIYIPMLTMSIQNASKYFSSISSSGLPIKTVEYDEVAYYPLVNVAIGRFDQMLTNSVQRIRALLVVPVVSKSVNGGGDSNATNQFGISPLSSPFSSACGTSTNAIITNYNVQLSGKAVYASNIDYGFEMFQHEVAQYYALGGNIDRQQASGLISQSNYENGYRYLFTNLSRKNKDYDNVGQSVNIRGVNSSNCILDFHCFIFYQKSIKINVADGTLISE